MPGKRHALGCTSEQRLSFGAAPNALRLCCHVLFFMPLRVEAGRHGDGRRQNVPQNEAGYSQKVSIWPVIGMGPRVVHFFSFGALLRCSDAFCR